MDASVSFPVECFSAGNYEICSVYLERGPDLLNINRDCAAARLALRRLRRTRKWGMKLFARGYFDQNRNKDAQYQLPTQKRADRSDSGTRRRGPPAYKIYRRVDLRFRFSRPK